MLVETIANGATDIALTPEVGKIAEAVKRDYDASAEKTRKQNRAQSMSELDS